VRELEDVVPEIMEDPIFKGNQNFHFEMGLDELGKRLFGSEANAGVSFQIGQLRYIPLHDQFILVHSTYQYILGCNMFNCCRAGNRTVSLAIVVYIDGSLVKHKLSVKPIYVTLCNLNSVVAGKAAAWCVLDMMPSLRKSETLAQTDNWLKDHRLRLHHAGIAHVVVMVNKFASEDKHLLCADAKVRINYECVCTEYVLVHTLDILVCTYYVQVYTLSY
jgi:hypothetical protein